MANTQNLDLVKPLGTDHALVSVLNSNSDKIDAYAGAVNAGLDGLRDGLGILADGNTHAAVTSGQFVYVKNHQTLPEGLYKATANIAANGTLSTSNLAADSAGGLNALNEQIGTLPIKSIQDIPIVSGDYTWNQIGNVYRTTIRVDSLFTKTGLKNVQILTYGGTPLFAIMDTKNIVVLVAMGNPANNEKITIRGFFNS